jgi:hypothetical protein
MAALILSAFLKMISLSRVCSHLINEYKNHDDNQISKFISNLYDNSDKDYVDDKKNYVNYHR